MTITHRKSFGVAIILALLSMLGCDRKAAPFPAAKNSSAVPMRIGSESFNLEIARTSAAQQIGLMNRASMPHDHGMIFVFKQEKPAAFWMKNTLIPLDVVFLDSAGQVVSIRHMQPNSEEQIPSGAPARYAIELNQGAAERCGVKIGDVLAIPPRAFSEGR